MQQALPRHHQRFGARIKIQICWRATPPTKSAGAKLRAGLTESPVMFKPTRIIKVKLKPITRPAILPLPLVADVTVMMTKDKDKGRNHFKQESAKWSHTLR